jgi:hypothetical protein
MIQVMSIMATTLVLADVAAAQQTRAAAKAAKDTIAMMATQPDSITLSDPVLVRRWASVWANLLEQFQKEQRSPVANIEGDFSELKMRVRLTSSRDDAWFTRTFTATELMNTDTKTTAEALYDSAKRKLK